VFAGSTFESTKIACTRNSVTGGDVSTNPTGSGGGLGSGGALGAGNPAGSPGNDGNDGMDGMVGKIGPSLAGNGGRIVHNKLGYVVGKRLC
jgi:hypothetical protein